MKNSKLGKVVYKLAKRNDLIMTDAKWKELDREERDWWGTEALFLHFGLKEVENESAGDSWEEFDWLDGGLRGKL